MALVVASVVALAVCCVLSLWIGANSSVSLSQVWHAFSGYHATVDEITVRQLRLPRTLVAVGAGASLAVAGALMQALARNPLADPGILGINSGAALAVVLALFLGGVTNPNLWVWAALPGALAGAVLVYGLASAGRDGVTTIKLVLAGAVVAAFVGSLTSTILFFHGLDTGDLLDLQQWTIGNVAGHKMSTVLSVAPMMVAGLVLSLLLGRPLNVLGLGEDAARSLGMRPAVVRSLAVLAITLLAGAATAEAGPIAFVGLAVPNAVRAVVGPDYRWILPLAAILGPVLLLAADILGRIVIAPTEVPTAIMVALVGAPVFLLLARRKRLVTL